MPGSWSKKKKNLMENTAHRQRPDLDNMVKGLIDAVYKEDAIIHTIEASKLWAATGHIIIIS